MFASCVISLYHDTVTSEHTRSDIGLLHEIAILFFDIFFRVKLSLVYKIAQKNISKIGIFFLMNQFPSALF